MRNRKDCAKIVHCFQVGQQRLFASLHTLDPQDFFGFPGRCGCSTIRGRRMWPENTYIHALPPDVKDLSKKKIGVKSKRWKFLGGRFAPTQLCLRSCSRSSAGCWGFPEHPSVAQHRMVMRTVCSIWTELSGDLVSAVVSVILHRPPTSTQLWPVCKNSNGRVLLPAGDRAP